MLKKLLVRIAAGCLLGCVSISGLPTPAVAMMHGSVASPNPNCPQPTGANDGCADLYTAGLQGTVQFPDAFTNSAYGPGSGQTYLSRLNENQAGVDYPIGVPASQGALIDPAVSQPTNCTYSATGSSAGGPKLTCGGGAVTIHGYQFGAVGGHRATVLHVNSNATSEDIQYNSFDNDSNTTASSNASDYAIFLAASGSTFNSIFSHNTINGECFHWDCSCCYQVVAYTSGSKTWDYNAWLWMPVRITSGCTNSCATIGDLNLRWSLVMGHDMTAALHGEWIEDIFSQTANAFTTQPHTNYIGSVIIQPNTAARQTTSNIYVSGGAAPTGPPIYSDVNVTDSSLICNSSPDWPAGSGGPGVICSALIDFQNGRYTNVHLTTVGMDKTGSLSSIRQDCDQLQFSGTVNASNILTVTGSSYTLGGYIYANPGAGSSWLWFDGAESGIRVGIPLTSDGPTRANLVNPVFNGTQLTYTSATLTNLYCNPNCAIQPGDLVTMAGVAPGTQFISSCGTNCWNTDINNGTLSAATGKANVRGFDGTYTLQSSPGAISSRTMVAYGGRTQATIDNLSMSGVIDMTKAAGSNSITAFDSLTGTCAVKHG